MRSFNIFRKSSFKVLSMYLRVFHIIIISLLSTNLLLSQEMPVPIDLQVQLFQKVLSFDRNLKARVGNDIVIGVVYQNNFRTSYEVHNQLITSIDSKSNFNIEGIPVTVQKIAIDKSIDLFDEIKRNNIDILYITPMRTVDIDAIIYICRSESVLTITGVPEYVEKGIAIGIGIKGDKPLVIINQNSAKNEGADFSAQLLKLAKVIQ